MRTSQALLTPFSPAFMTYVSKISPLWVWGEAAQLTGSGLEQGFAVVRLATTETTTAQMTSSPPWLSLGFGTPEYITDRTL